MKNRRIAIASFLVVAILVMGIGFAAITGTLNIAGTAKYQNSGEIKSDVHTAVKFKSATGVQNCTATITDTLGDAANMSVTFIDQTTEPETFYAIAEYVIMYGEGENTDNLAPVMFEDYGADDITNNNADFGLSVKWLDEEDNEIADITTYELEFGHTVTLEVTVSYTSTDSQGTNATGGFNISLPYTYQGENTGVVIE